MGIVCVYLAEILLELTLGPISTRSLATNELLRETGPLFLELVTYAVIIIVCYLSINSVGLMDSLW